METIKDAIRFNSNSEDQPDKEIFGDEISSLNGSWYDIIHVDNIDNKNQIHIYPNPALNNLIIDGINNKCTISIMNIIGNNLVDINYKNDNIIDVSGLNNGIYILKVLSGSDVYVEKFVIQK